MNIWREKSKTGATVHLTFDREKTFCGRKIGDDWKFLFLLRDRTEAMEHVEGLCQKCNAINLEEWEKEFVDGEEPIAEQEASGDSGEEVDEITAEPVVESDSGTVEPVRADRTSGLGTW